MCIRDRPERAVHEWAFASGFSVGAKFSLSTRYRPPWTRSSVPVDLWSTHLSYHWNSCQWCSRIDWHLLRCPRGISQRAYWFCDHALHRSNDGFPSSTISHHIGLDFLAQSLDRGFGYCDGQLGANSSGDLYTDDFNFGERVY